MAIPLWMQIVYGDRVAPQGQRAQTSRTSVSNVRQSQLGAQRRRSGGGGRAKKDYGDDIKGTIAKLKDQGLSKGQIDDILNGERGNHFDPLSPGDYLDTAGDVLGKVLEGLSTPGAYALSAANEFIAEPLSEIPGVGEGLSVGSDRFRQTGAFNPSDFLTNAANLRKGELSGADILRADPGHTTFGVDTSKGAGKAASAVAGFGVEAAFDPLNYLGVGIGDEPGKVANALRDKEAISSIAKAKGISDDAARLLAEKTAVEVRQKGTSVLKDPDLLEAIGRKGRGGIELKVPGTGPIGRLTRLDSALEKLSGGELARRVSIAPAGTKVGDFAQDVAQVARKPVNRFLKATAPLVEKGLSGDAGKLKAIIRNANPDDPAEVAKAVKAMDVLKFKPVAKGVAKALEQTWMKRWDDLKKQFASEGIDLEEITHAVRRGDPEVVKLGDVIPEAVEAVRTFNREFREAFNEAGGIEYIRDAGPNYVTRVLTDETKKKFGLSRQGSRNVESIAVGRKYKAGELLEITNAEGKKISTPLVDAAEDELGRSVEEQIADFLVENGHDEWFETDLSKIMPEMIKRGARQLEREYLGTELRNAGVGYRYRNEDKFVQGETRRIDVPPATAAPGEHIAPTGTSYLDLPTARAARERRNDYTKEIFDLTLHPVSAEETKRRSGMVNQLVDIRDQLDEVVQKPPLDYEKIHERIRGLSETDIALPFKDMLMRGYAQFGANTQVPVDIAEALRSMGKVAATDWKGFWGKFDRVQNLWKKAALLTPGYHWRNGFGGLYMNWMGDVDEGRYRQLLRLAYDDPSSALYQKKHVLPLVAGVKLDDELREAYTEAKRVGVFTGGQSIKEIEDVGRKIPLSPFRGSRRLGGMIENELRGAMFIDDYVKNHDVNEALAKVMKYHFDYEDISQFEQQYLRRVIPFYTWTRRSVPLMFEMIVRNPGKVNKYFQLQRNIESLSDEDPFTPAYFQRQFAIRLPWETGGGQAYAMPDLPLMSLVDASESSNLLGQLSPAIKTPIELWSGKQFYKDLPITDKKVPIPPYLRWLEGPMRSLDLVKTGANGEPVMTERKAYLLTQFLPQLGQARRLWPAANDERYKDRQLTSAISFFLGLGLRTNTQDEQQNELWRRFYSYEDETKRNEQLGYETDAARTLAYGTP